MAWWLSGTGFVFKTAAGAQRLLAGIPLGRWGQPGDVVGPGVFSASDVSAFVTGALVPVDGGKLALNAGGSINS